MRSRHQELRRRAKAACKPQDLDTVLYLLNLAAHARLDLGTGLGPAVASDVLVAQARSTIEYAERCRREEAQEEQA